MRKGDRQEFSGGGRNGNSFLGKNHLRFLPKNDGADVHAVSSNEQAALIDVVGTLVRFEDPTVSFKPRRGFRSRPPLFFPPFSDRVLHPVLLLGALGVVKAVQRAHQIAGDPADPVEGNLAKIVG